MKYKHAVYESPSIGDAVSIVWKLIRGIRIWVIEPFPAYHHKRSVKFYPVKTAQYVNRLIQTGKISVLWEKNLQGKDIYALASDAAVRLVGDIYPAYRKQYARIIGYTADILRNDPAAENGFKKNLCDRVAEFYSVNILLARIEACIKDDSIQFYPDTDVWSYQMIKKLVSQTKCAYDEPERISIPRGAWVASLIKNITVSLSVTVKLLAQTLASAMFIKRDHGTSEKKDYRYGMAITSPRQFENNLRRSDFIIDEKRITSREVVYFPLIPTSKVQDEILDNLPGSVCSVPKLGSFFSNASQWKTLLALAFRNRFLCNHSELITASQVLLHYFIWRSILSGVSIRHFITHADFALTYIGRNIALKEAGVETWYFTDSANLGYMFCEQDECRMHHPFWTYLNYDHLVTWHDCIAEFHQDHPGSFDQTHVVGCLWSDHVQSQSESRASATFFDFSVLNNTYVLSCFDSTFSINGKTSYQEGITFAMHLVQLADENEDVQIFLKEKKDRRIHEVLDPQNGPKLIEVYDRMDKHPRIKMFSNQIDASELISAADMVISFPFTSTTVEALSANRPAIWHDPLGLYRETLYGKAGQVVTHSYSELKAKVLVTKEMCPDAWQNPIPKDSPLLDPFRDGQAIDRFREFLATYS